ncbi:histone-lysine N-methyltransferase ASHH3-like isoform X1 [Canna indica]|uniref:Histone-lysine N-methyltransferase ASHH3-like isoform X1 n=1 Tax=Canna indica TaxID=4628 RepID=A0AAQ3JPQ5_9LILI|nr:histone-lysine N-methyltransferase ASHH3-like isoform X1 [Canna indica]
MPALKNQKHEQGNIEQIFEKLIKELSNQDDFDLPSWLKKWKPAQYIGIKRNVYLTKRRIEDDGIFCSCSPSSGSSTVCDGDCHCGMLFSCCSSSCKCGAKCLNKSFQHRDMKKMKVVKTENCGFGLVAEDDIKQGDFVIEYVGEVLDDKACEERLWKMKHRGDTNFYLCEVNHDMVIDATYKGNKSRFINHSCEPNTEMQKWRADGETRVGIFALRNIRKDEHVTYDYQFVQFGADQVCYCGTPSCRQKLGNKPRSSNTGHHKRKTKYENCIGELVRVWRSRDKRYYGGFISDFDSYSGKHTIMYTRIHDSLQVPHAFTMLLGYAHEMADRMGPSAQPILDLQFLSLLGSLFSVIRGYFNITLHNGERRNCVGNPADSRRFSKFLADFGLMDTPLSGSSYTWTNNQTSQGLAKLNRILISNGLSAVFPNLLALTGDRKLSNHSPLLLKMKPTIVKSRWPFRIENNWLLLDHFSNIIKAKFRSCSLGSKLLVSPLG